MSDLARLVEALYVLRGYEAEPSPGGHVLRFRKGKEHVAVRVREGRDPVPAFLAHEVAETLPALGHAVLVCLGDLGHEARSILERGGIDVWTREKLIHEVGKGFLDAAEHKHLAEALTAAGVGPSPPLVHAPTPPAPEPGPELAAGPMEVPAPAPVAPAMSLFAPPPPVATPAPMPAPTPAPAMPRLWSRPAAAPSVLSVPAAAPTPPPAMPLTPDLVRMAPPPPAAPPPPPPPPVAAAPAPVAVVEGSVLAAVVDRDSAAKLGVGRLLKVDRIALDLVPLHAFRYSTKLEAKGVPPIPKHGLLAVDAVTGAVRELPEPVFGTITGPAEKLQALLPELEAVPLVKQKIVELHTQKIRVKNNLGRNSLIVEDRVVRPDLKTLQLEPQGLWWLPTWRLEGQNGTLRINAATGAVEEEKLKRAFAQDAEFL